LIVCLKISINNTFVEEEEEEKEMNSSENNHSCLWLDEWWTNGHSL